MANCPSHYNDVIMSTMASQITSLTSDYSIIYSGADQRKHQSSASLAFGRGIHRWPVNSPHKGPVTRKKFPFDYIIMIWFHLMTSCQLMLGTGNMGYNSIQSGYVQAILIECQVTLLLTDIILAFFQLFSIQLYIFCTMNFALTYL